MRLPRTLTAVAAVLGLAAVPAVPALLPTLPDVDLGDLCVADLADATSLVTEMATVAPQRSTAAGVDIVVVTDPLVPPGIPTAVLDTASGMCAVDTFNLTLAPALGSVETVASVFASTAGMRWLGDVEVRDLAVDGDTITLTTFGGRHNVTSEWTITVDALGVREASFETVAFATDLELGGLGDLEGITSRPGHGRSWTRDASGMLAINATILDDLAADRAQRDAASERAARAAGLAPGDFLETTFADGQTVRITLGVAATGVETPITGVDQVDRLTLLNNGIRQVYEDFMTWGLDDPWDNTSRTYFGFGTVAPDDAGYINISSGLSAYCLACAFLTDAIEIHAEYVFPEIAQPLVNVSYPDAEEFFIGVMGHELVHSMQGGYASTGGALTTAFTEATARASEGLYYNAEGTHQPRSIAYVDNANGCAGFENGRGGWIDAQAAGPFLDRHTYDSCYFFWTYYAQYGGEGLISLLEAMPAGSEGNAAARNLSVLDRAAQILAEKGLREDADGTRDLAYWAAAYTTGDDADGYTFADATKGEDGTIQGVERNWFLHLDEDDDRSRALRRGQPLNVTVANGGTAGFEIRTGGTLSQLPSGAEAFLFEVHEGHLDIVGPVVVGDEVEAGQILSIVAPATGEYAGTVAIS